MSWLAPALLGLFVLLLSCSAPEPTAPETPRELAGMRVLIQHQPQLVGNEQEMIDLGRARGLGPAFGAMMEKSLARAGLTIVRRPEEPHDFEMHMLIQGLRQGNLRRGFFRAWLTVEGRYLDEIVWEWPPELEVDPEHHGAYAALQVVGRLLRSEPLRQLSATRSRAPASADASAAALPPASPTTLGSADPTAALAEAPRTALVIGVGGYRVGRLRNANNDARAVAAALRDLRFRVTEQHDLNQRQLKLSIRGFGEKLRAGGVGLFYFAGHGLQIKGRNYLVPIRADIPSEAYVDLEAVALDEVLAAMDSAGNQLNIVVLDACRNNPFASRFRSLHRGLAFIDAPRGTLIAYATAPGSVADDGASGNGVYTAALVKHLKTPGVPIESVFKAVRREVAAVTRGSQTPWESSSLTGEFYFLPTEPSDSKKSAE